MPCKACHKPKAEKQTKLAFEVGRRYKDLLYGDEYICAHVDGYNAATAKFALINLGNGNRFRNPSDLQKVGDPGEFKLIK